MDPSKRVYLQAARQDSCETNITETIELTDVGYVNQGLDNATRRPSPSSGTRRNPFLDIYLKLPQGINIVIISSVYYNPHPKDGEGNIFAGVCLLTRVVPSPVTGPVPSAVPGPFQGGTPYSCHLPCSWSCPLPLDRLHHER